jgi:hypothetical protein
MVRSGLIWIWRGDCGHGCGSGCAAQGCSQRSSIRCERRHIQLRPTLAKLAREKWTTRRGVVSGYGVPAAQNPAYSPLWHDGGEPPRRPVVGAPARTVRARAMGLARWTFRPSGLQDLSLEFSLQTRCEGAICSPKCIDPKMISARFQSGGRGALPLLPERAGSPTHRGRDGGRRRSGPPPRPAHVRGSGGHLRGRRRLRRRAAP